MDARALPCGRALRVSAPLHTDRGRSVRDKLATVNHRNVTNATGPRHRGPVGHRGRHRAQSAGTGSSFSASSASARIPAATSCVMCIEQNFGPHIEQNSALLK